MTYGTTAGPRIQRGPVRRCVVTAALATLGLVALPAPAAHAAGPLDAMCYVDRSGFQTLTMLTYARVSPGDVAVRIDVACWISGRDYGYTRRIEATGVGVAAVMAAESPLVGADTYTICYAAAAKMTTGETVSLDTRCYTGSPFA